MRKLSVKTLKYVADRFLIVQEYTIIEMDADEFAAVMRNLDSWERLMNVKFVEADVTGYKAIIKAMPVATPGFFVFVQEGETKLMVEVTSDSRIGYVDLEEFAEFDEKLLEQLKHRVIYEDNGGTSQDGHFFPKSQKSVELFKTLMQTATWKRLN